MADDTQEALKNCGHCKKTVEKTKRYYRNGKYYCTKNCWRAAKEEAAKAKEEA